MHLNRKALCILLLGIVILLVQVACKEETVSVPVEATWTQEILDTSVFGGWEIYVANSENGTYSLLVKVPFTEVSDVYSYTKVIQVPENTNAKRWFKMKAYHKDGQKSPWSNVFSLVIQT